MTGFVNLLSKYSHSPPPVTDIRGSAHSFLSDDAGVETLGGGLAFPIKIFDSSGSGSILCLRKGKADSII